MSGVLLSTPLPFAGAAVPLTPADLARAAGVIGCPIAAVQAVRIVETGGVGGYLDDGSGRPRVLCESKLFGDDTGHRFDVSHPLISTRVANWKLYKGGAAEYGRLAEMVALDRTAALRSTSWGMFQVLGRNADSTGFHVAGTHAGDVEAFVAAMMQSEAAQLDAFVAFVQFNGLATALRRQDWATFARGYNGPLYAINGYDTKLEAAFSLAVGVRPVWLRIGCTGVGVRDLQAALTAHGFPVTADGSFGRVTDLAVRNFQSASGLAVDGIEGRATMQALGL